MKLKTTKAISKRFKVTKNKKVLKRREGQGHFNSRATGSQTRRKRRDIQLSSTHNRQLRAGMPYAGL